MTSVSVVVAARDAAASIGTLLDALSAQTHGEVEVLVADDASRDRTAAVAEERGARVVRCGGRARGAYAARNAALPHAGGDVIAITDADCVPRADWIERLLAALAGADAAGGPIRLTLPPDPSLAALVDASRRLDQAAFHAQGFLAFANFACRRELLDRVGPFNAALASNGDREWCLRASAAGARLAYAPRAIVEHHTRTRAREVAATWWRRGVGRGRTTVVGAGPAGAAHGANWSARAEYLPLAVVGARHPAAARLREAGHTGGRADLARIDGATYLLAGLPLLAGYAAGTLGARLTAAHAAELPSARRDL